MNYMFFKKKLIGRFVFDGFERGLFIVFVVLLDWFLICNLKSAKSTVKAVVRTMLALTSQIPNALLAWLLQTYTFFSC